LTFTGIAVQVGSKLLPAIQSLTTWFIKLFQSDRVKEFTTTLSGMATKFTEFIKGILEGKIDAGDVLKFVTDFIANLITGFVSRKAQALEIGFKLIQMIVDAISQNVGTILPAAIGIVSRLAAEISKQIPLLIPKAIEIITTLIKGIIDNLPQLITIGLEIITAVIMGIVNAIPTLVENAPIIITNIVSALINAIPQIIEAAGKIVSAIINVIMSTDWNAVGAKIAAGIAAGLSQAQAATAFNPSSYSFQQPGFLGQLPFGKASGGSVYPNQSYVVGEKGPEVFRPSGSGAIIPNSQIGGGIDERRLARAIRDAILQVMQ
jgi:phage-related protein